MWNQVNSNQLFSPLGLVLLNLIIASPVTFNLAYAAPVDFLGNLTETQRESFNNLMAHAIGETKQDPHSLIRLALQSFREKEFLKPSSVSSSASLRRSNSMKAPYTNPLYDDFFKATKSIVDEVEATTSTTPPPSLSSTTTPTSEPTRVDSSSETASIEIVTDSPTEIKMNETIPSETKDLNEEKSISIVNVVEERPIIKPNSLEVIEPTTESSTEETTQSSDQELVTEATLDVTSEEPEKVEIQDESFIDVSDPEDPKKVRVRSKSKSKINSDGSSHERHESRTSSSLLNGIPAFSHSASSFVTRTTNTKADKQQTSDALLYPPISRQIPIFNPYGIGYGYVIPPMIPPYSPYWLRDASRNHMSGKIPISNVYPIPFMASPTHQAPKRKN